MTNTLDQEIATRAPHVDRQWADEFIVELRLRGASGAAIGASLMEIESHMASQQGSIIESFGDAAAYAQSLELPDTQQWSRDEALKLGINGVLGVIGIYLLLAGVLAFGSEVQIPSYGLIGLVAVNVLAVAALIKWDAKILRFFLDRAILGALIVTALMTVVVGATFIPGPQFIMAPAVAMGIGLGALAIALAQAISAKRSKKTLADPITWPVD